MQLIAVITPDNASNKTVSWSSSSDTIASVNSTGLIKAKTPGQTTITVTANDGSGITATCNITVEKLVTNINELKAGDSVYYEDGQGAKQLCAVLYDSTSEYGVEIITMGTVENITLGSEDFNASMNSYNNAITTLNNATSRYLNPTYADKIRCVGSLPNNPSYDGEKMFVSSYDYMSKYNGYFKGEDNNYITDWNQMEKLGIRDINKFYWLASRYTVDGEANSWVRCTKC